MTEAPCPNQSWYYGCTPPPGTTVATAVHGPAAEVTSLTYDGFSETRTYNSMLQLTRMTATGAGQTVIDMQYTFSGTENNGRDATDTSCPRHIGPC
jgi:hypothetical protein